jgi:hypothetical protein
MIINKNNIIFVTTLCSKRCRTHTSEWIRSKCLAEEALDKYGSCICFPSLQPLHWKLDSIDVWPKQPVFINDDKRDPQRWPRWWCHLAKEDAEDDVADDIWVGCPMKEERHKVSKT